MYEMSINDYMYILFCWFVSQGSMMGMLTGLIHAEDTFHALACSCGVPSIIPAGELVHNTDHL